MCENGTKSSKNEVLITKTTPFGVNSTINKHKILKENSKIWYFEKHPEKAMTFKIIGKTQENKIIYDWFDVRDVNNFKVEKISYEDLKEYNLTINWTMQEALNHLHIITKIE